MESRSEVSVKAFFTILMLTFLALVSSIVLCTFTSSVAWAQGSPTVGREAAAKYFTPRDPAQVYNAPPNGGPSDHYLALHYGRYMSSQSYDWGKGGNEDDIGGNNFGVTYRVGEWYNSMDLKVRIEYQEFDVGGESPDKLSFLPVVSFPDASSRFPLYFGAGIGLGIFLKQVSGKSALSLDYQLVAGARFFDVFENTGFFVEAGLKNHLHILSSGQFNGTFLAGGLVFTF